MLSLFVKVLSKRVFYQTWFYKLPAIQAPHSTAYIPLDLRFRVTGKTSFSAQYKLLREVSLEDLKLFSENTIVMFCAQINPVYPSWHQIRHDAYWTTIARWGSSQPQVGFHPLVCFGPLVWFSLLVLIGPLVWFSPSV